MDNLPGCPAVGAPSQQTGSRTGDQDLVVGWTHGEGEDRGVALLGQRRKTHPRRGGQSGAERRNDRPGARQQRHKRRDKTFARKRHERADYHPRREADGLASEGDEVAGRDDCLQSLSAGSPRGLAAQDRGLA